MPPRAMRLRTRRTKLLACEGVVGEVLAGALRLVVVVGLTFKLPVRVL